VIAVASDDAGSEPVLPAALSAPAAFVFVWSPALLSPVAVSCVETLVGFCTASAVAVEDAVLPPSADRAVTTLVFVWSPRVLSPVPETWTAVLTGTSAGVFVWSPVVFPCPVVST
jgi:hypothetical protein